MARTKKTEEMEQNLITAEEVLQEEKTNEEEICLTNKGGEAPVMLEDLAADDLMSDDRGLSKEMEEEVMPEMDIIGELPAGTESSSGSKESSEETKAPSSLPKEANKRLEETGVKKTKTRRKKIDAAAESNAADKAEKYDADTVKAEPARQSIIIPIKEMMINLSENVANYGDMMLRQNKILGTMLGAEVDFVVKGIDSKTRSVVASRKDAMLKKRQLFYMNTDTDGMYRIHENRIVQARVIAVADKVIRVEIFGVECSILARDLTWDWLGDAHERFNVGDQILVRILSVKRDSLEDIAVRADVKSVTNNTGRENLSKCRVMPVR